MSTFKYGNVEMRIVKTNRAQRVSRRTDDNAEHVITDWHLDLEGWWNPAATSYFGDVNNVIPAAFPGSLPPITDNAIREYLMQSRRRIDYRDDLGNKILYTPADGYTQDADNGPYVAYCDVVEIHGEKSWKIRMIVQASVVECPGPGLTPSPLIANRWTQWMDTDEDYFSTIITEGVAVFRGDEIAKLGTYPDQYRRDLLFAVPNNYKREVVRVEQGSDINTVRYRIVDREKALNINQRYHSRVGVSRIEGYHTGGYYHPGSLEATGQIVGNAIEGAGVGGIGGAGIGAVPGAVLGAGAGFLRNVPQWNNGIVVSIWGHRNATRMEMTFLALAIATQRLGQGNFLGVFVRNTRWTLTHDIMGKYVRLEIQQRWGVEQMVRDLTTSVGNFFEQAWTVATQSLAGMLGAQEGQPADVQAAQAAQVQADTFGPGAIANALNFPPIWDNTGDIIGSGDPNHFNADGTLSQDSSADLRTHPPPPNSGGTRGTSLLTIVAQLLNDPCEKPAQPPALTQYTDLPLYE
jgi:hypothetical protein